VPIIIVLGTKIRALRFDARISWPMMTFVAFSMSEPFAAGWHLDASQIGAIESTSQQRKSAAAKASLCFWSELGRSDR